jgi:hypothetical protein
MTSTMCPRGGIVAAGGKYYHQEPEPEPALGPEEIEAEVAAAS